MIAQQVPEIHVSVVDIDAKRIEAWNSNVLPIFEPLLFEIVQTARDGDGANRQPNLLFTTKIDEAVADADVIFVSVNTPTKMTGHGAGSALDLGFVEAATRKIAQVSKSDKIVVEKSTVPCRTAESIRDILAANGKPGVRFDVLSNPEFLAEGTIISDLVHPDRILIGSLPTSSGLEAARALADLYAIWVPRDHIITMNLWSSELAKLAANALLAQRISSINALSAICEATGAEIDEVSYAVGLDRRIGPHMLKSSVGFGGSCFKKDILSLVYLANSLHLPEVAAYWKSVVDINEWQKDRFTKRIISCLYNTLTSKKIAIFGFAYKKNTGDTRESAALTIVNSLVDERANVTIYDPQVRPQQIWQDLAAHSTNFTRTKECVTICKNAYEACLGAHAIVIVTEWDEFRNGEDRRQHPIHRASSGKSNEENGIEAGKLGKRTSSMIRLELPKSNPRVDWSRIASLMSKPMFVFDGRNIVDPTKLEELGFRVECIGHTRSVLHP